MRISDMIKMGLRNLARRKARTALTVIGVIIGTISIVVMVSIGVGMNKSYQSSVMQRGSLTTIKVRSYADIFDSDGNWTNSKEQKLDDSVVEAIRSIKHVRAVAPVLNTEARIKSGKYESYVSLRAMDLSQAEVFDFPELEKGKFPTQEQPRSIVFGGEALHWYNPNSRFGGLEELDLDKIKMQISLNVGMYQINEKKKEYIEPIQEFGVLEKTESSDFDYYAYIDINYFKQMYMKYCNTLKVEDRKKAIQTIQNYQEITVNVDNVKQVDYVVKEIEKMGYVSDSLLMLLKPVQETADMLEMVLGGIGGIAMLVSAISIANTMIMSIYERTKEIGVMKVLGCFIRDIKLLFLFESAMIGLIGGVIGVGLSYLASYCINKYGAPLFKSLMSTNMMYDMSTATFSQIPIWLPVVALAFAMIIGIVSGYYPARRATRISAIEAMKTE